MVELAPAEVSEKEMLEAIWFGQRHCRTLVELQEDMARESGKANGGETAGA